MLQVEGIALRRTDGARVRQVLDDISFGLAPGQVAAIWGPSGSGKTTLLNLVGGLLQPDAGAIRVLVSDATGGTREIAVHALSNGERLRYRRRHVGFVFQFLNLLPTLTVEENVLLPLELNGMREGADLALRRLDALGVGDARQRFPDALSGGEQQRVAIARALAHAPTLVLADEPTGNLDAANAERVADCLWEQVRDAQAGLVIATHNERLAQRADTVVRLR